MNSHPYITPSPADFNRIIQKKIMQIEALQRLIAIWRMQAKRIVFTNGCFDLLHPGHIHLLNAARSFGDILIAGLNTDESVRRLKPGRPLQDEEARSMIMASLEVVDAVILFNAETPLELIKRIMPDVLVKGGDYKPEEIAGRNEVEANGGIVEIVPLKPGFSTSLLIAHK